MRKFFVENVDGDEIFITGSDVNHIKNVLRLDIGEKILICDKLNFKNYICSIEEKLDTIKCKVLEEIEGISEGNVELHIFQGLPKADKMELIIQKGTELGISKYIPVKLSRCIVKLDGKDEVKKIERWQKISEVAAKQSGRDMVPKVISLKTFKEVKNIISEYDLFLVAYEEEKDNTLKNELINLKNKKENYKVACLIGPEGGLTFEEVNELEQAGAKVITLGNRILRTETVAMYIASTVMYELEMN